MKIRIRRALISVHDKSGLVELASFLAQNSVEIIATGNTHKMLTQNNIKSIPISEYTGFPEILNGRVKVLNPKIFAGILGIEDDFSHIKDKKEHNIPNIDLVVVNLYPFKELMLKQNTSESDMIENIDIGGPSLIRASAKNFAYVCVLTSPSQYQSLTIETEQQYRRDLAKAAFALTADYEINIYNWFCTQQKNETEHLIFSAKKHMDFRYGENPHQKSSFFSSQPLPFTKVQGKELSYNNILDLDVGLLIVKEFTEPTVAIIKHNNPCGVASSSNTLDAYQKALNADLLSSYGGVVAFNSKITEKTAIEIIKTFIEVIVAPEIEENAKLILAKKPNMRVLLCKKYINKHNIRSALNGILVQEENETILNNGHYDIVTKSSTSNENIAQLLFAWKVCKYVKSNAIVIAKNNVTLSIGAGQTSRIDSVKIAIAKAGKEAHGAVLASDGFFPFADSITAAHQAGIVAIIEPGGSIRDNEVIQEADKHHMCMLFTNIRHFRH